MESKEALLAAPLCRKTPRAFFLLLDVRGFRGADCDADRYLVVAKLRERLAVRKQAAQKFEGKKFNLRKLKELEVKEKYH